MDFESLLARVTARYLPADYPALHSQVKEPGQLSHLAGLHLLDATPVFTNTLAKYAALHSAGATVHVSVSPALPHDPGVVAELRSWGVQVVNPTTAGRNTYDVVMDCAGVHAEVSSRLGFVELTRSGVTAYADCAQPVVIADDGKAKLIENALGTADGWVRAMSHFDSPVDGTSHVVLFGHGKVGRGVVLKCRQLGAALTIVDPRVDDALHPDDFDTVSQKIAAATCVVAATGVTGALTPYAQVLLSSQAVLANLGATDEFGPAIPPTRALHSKAPVNFALEEPTRMPFIDRGRDLCRITPGDLGDDQVGHSVLQRHVLGATGHRTSRSRDGCSGRNRPAVPRHA